MPEIMTGEDKAWEILASMAPETVCRNTGASHAAGDKVYTLLSFGKNFSFDPERKIIQSLDEGGEIFLTRLGYFYRLSSLWYLVKARDIEPSGKHVEPSGLSGGDIFFRGTHVLPLDAVAKKYACDKEGFLAKGLAMGGRQASYGDVSVELFPFPRIPVTLILWLGDEEWPPRFKLLFDSSVTRHVPLDIAWSISMMSVLSFM